MVELARALAQHPAVYRVDLLTRQIQDPQVDKEYGEAEECLYSGSLGGLGGAYIVRLPCGKPKEYLRCGMAAAVSILIGHLICLNRRTAG